MPDVFAGLPCRDEDVAREAPGDYALLAPKCERLTEGTDGAFLDGATWDLTSAENDFAAQEIQAGHVLVLDSRAGVDANNRPKAIPMGKQCLGISAASGHAATLRRLGYSTGIGRPPGAPSGLSAITFYVPSVLAQIADESIGVRRDLAIPAITDLSTLPDLKEYAALRVLQSLYFAEYRQTNNDTWKDKGEKLYARINSLYADLKESYGDVATPGRGLVVADLSESPAWSDPSRGGDPFRRNWRRVGWWE